MDKYEYKVRSEEIRSLIGQGNYAQAAEIADAIDWRRVKSVMMLCTVSDLYKINRRFEDAKNMLLLAYERRPGGRTICYSLCELCTKTGEFVQALKYYKEFVRVAPRDTGRYILQYKLYEAQEVSLEERISVLEELKKRDYREKWAYELAYLYHRVGLATRCVEECDELILWFGEGKYVVKAMELKMLHQPLTPAQKEAYERRFEKEAVPAQGQEEAYGDEADYGQEAVESQEDYGWPPEEESMNEGGGEPVYAGENDSGQKQQEELDIQVKTMDVGKYNTINLQAELAAGLQEVLGAEEMVHGSGRADGGYAQEAWEPSDPEYQDSWEGEIEDSEVFFGATGEIEDTLPELETAEEGAEAGEEPTEEPQILTKEEAVSLEEETDGAAPEKGAAEESAPQEKKQGMENASKTLPVFQPPREMAEVLSQEADGQISMVLPESAVIEKQITGQMKLDDILVEWERIKKENEAKCQEEVRQHVLTQTGSMFTEFEANIRDGLLEQLEKGEPGQGNGAEQTDLSQGFAGNGGEYAEGRGTAAGGAEHAEEPEAGGAQYADAEEAEAGDAEYGGVQEPADGDAGDGGTGEPAGEDAEYAIEPEAVDAEYADAEEPAVPGAGYNGAEELEAGDAEYGDAEELEAGNAEYGDAEEPAVPGAGYNGAEELEAGDAEYGDAEELEAGDAEYADAEELEAGDAEYADAEEPAAGDAEYTGTEEALYGMEGAEPGEMETGDETEYPDEDENVIDPGYAAAQADEAEYAQQEAYGQGDYYIEDAGYEEESEYIEESGAEDGLLYEEYADYVDASDYAEGPETAEETEYGEDGDEQTGYGEENSEENEPEYIDEAEYGNEAAYAGEAQAEYEEANCREAVEDTDNADKDQTPFEDLDIEEEDIVDEIVEIQEQIEAAERPERAEEPEEDNEPEKDAPPFIEHDRAKVRGLTREEKELFAPYIQNRRSREQLVKALDSVSMAAYTGNLIITGEEGMDTLTLAKNMMREIRMTDSNFSGKVAKVSGQGLNEKNMADTLEQLGNGALIIQKASGMSAKTAAMLHRQLQHERFGIIVVLEDTQKAIKKLFLGTPDLYGDFTARVDLEALSNDALVAFGRQYAREKEYSIDNLGVLALHTRIEEMQTIDHVVTVMEVKQIMDQAMHRASRKTLGHFFDILLARRYDDEDMVILTEKDFVA